MVALCISVSRASERGKNKKIVKTALENNYKNGSLCREVVFDKTIDFDLK
jgi:hypothetical protein